jgi:hypothetical protein
MNYHERLKIINKDIQKREVLDSIDRPIKPLVIELNRIGLKTKFSCCGFSYDGEEEPKTHTKNQSYVQFFYPDLNNPTAVKNFFQLSLAVVKWNWSMWPFSNVWELEFKIRKVGMENFYDQKDGIPQSIHDYEGNVIAIYNLTEELKTFPSVATSVTIEDGNSNYSKLTEWQIKPKQKSIVNFS